MSKLGGWGIFGVEIHSLLILLLWCCKKNYLFLIEGKSHQLYHTKSLKSVYSHFQDPCVQITKTRVLSSQNKVHVICTLHGCCSLVVSRVVTVDAKTSVQTAHLLPLQRNAWMTNMLIGC